jgi:hypothetical protein
VVSDVGCSLVLELPFIQALLEVKALDLLGDGLEGVVPAPVEDVHDLDYLHTVLMVPDHLGVGLARTLQFLDACGVRGVLDGQGAELVQAVDSALGDELLDHLHVVEGGSDVEGCPEVLVALDGVDVLFLD